MSDQCPICKLFTLKEGKRTEDDVLAGRTGKKIHKYNYCINPKCKWDSEKEKKKKEDSPLMKSLTKIGGGRN